MVVALLGYVGILFAVAGQEDTTQEAVTQETPAQEKLAAITEETFAQEAPAADSGEAVYYPDYQIGLFSHKKHVSGTGLVCTNCHTEIFQMAAGAAKASGDFNKISFGEGRYCGACHNGSTAFTVQDEANCRRCHGSDVNPPDTILLKESVKAVIFDHALHNKELGLACNECHMSLFDMKTGSTSEKEDYNMEAMYNGKYCGACHNGSMAFDIKGQCTKCHTEMPGYDRVTSGSDEKKAEEH